MTGPLRPAHPRASRPDEGIEIETTTADRDIRDVMAAYERRVATVRPEHHERALALLGRLTPDRWPLEWRLPWWLGDALGLGRGVTNEIVLGNVLGLAHVRLADDLADGDVEPTEVVAATELGDALLEAALDLYRPRFEADSPFWAHVDACLGAWRQSMAVDVADGGGPELAARGAPLRISAFAVCLLAGSAERYAPLERCLDQALEALVLLDHVADWEADLEAGRWNAFVAHVAGARPDPRREAVLVALLTSDASADYFERIDGSLEQAIALAESPAVAVEPLAAHLREFATRVRGEGMDFQAHYRGLGDRAAGWLLRGTVDVRS